MSLKRQRPQDDSGIPKTQTSKRPKVNRELAQIWEKLVDEIEDIRLDAVSDLLTVHCVNNDRESAETIAKRLFRGLCSSRKNARQGFYVALVGALSSSKQYFGTAEILLADIIEILDTQTTPETGTSGQDERDHHYGRLLGCKAILESKALWDSGDQCLGLWEQIVEILCKLMAQKPWLRAEGGVLICSIIPKIRTIADYQKDKLHRFMSPLFQRLKEYRLWRTIDGIGIWLNCRSTLTNAKLPKDIWTADSPLYKSELARFKRIMLGQHNSSEEEDLSGSAVWSARLHPTWRTVISSFTSPDPGQVSFEDFWIEVVDQGLFDPSATPERKYTGFLVFGCALKITPTGSSTRLFSKNLVACMIQSLQTQSDAYLRNLVLKVFKDYDDYLRAANVESADQVILGLIQSSGHIDFDTVTKTKIISSLLHVRPVYKGILSRTLLQDLQEGPGSDMPTSKIVRKRIAILNILARAMCQAIRELEANEAVLTGPVYTNEAWAKISEIIFSLLKLRADATGNSDEMVRWEETSRSVLREKISIILDACLAAGEAGYQCFHRAVSSLQEIAKLEADDQIQEDLLTGWTVFKQISTKHQTHHDDSLSKSDNQVQRGILLLPALLLYEIYDGDTEAIEMLNEVTSMLADYVTDQDHQKLADQILDIVISFMSKPSRFRRRACNLIFESFAPHFSSDGLDSISRILTTQESRSGQQELFENEDDDLSEDGSASSSISLDSDVEVVDPTEDDESDSDDTTISSIDDDSESEVDTEEDTNGNGSSSEDGDDEVAKFEEALAAALGTRKFNEEDMADADSDAGTSSDSDMSDSDMMELDDKLAEVFRNQQSQTSAQKLRKEEMKNAKENVVNLKNRAVDLTELFFRSQHEKGMECAKLLVSLVQMAQMSNNSHLASRGNKLVSNFAQRYKKTKLPKVRAGTANREELWRLLRAVHETAAYEKASNSVIAASSQVNILLCRLLLEAGEPKIGKKMQVISNEFKSGPEAPRRAYAELWNRYDAWISSVDPRAEKPIRLQAEKARKDRNEGRPKKATKT